MQEENRIINCHFEFNRKLCYGKITIRNGIYHVLELPRRFFDNPPPQFICFSETNEIILLNNLVHEETHFQQILFFENMIMGFRLAEDTKNLKFTSINFDFPYINAFFFGLDAITNGCDNRENNLCLFFETTNKKIKYKYNNKFEIEVIHGCKTSHSRFGTGKSKMELYKHLKIKSKKPCKLKEFITIINDLIKFFSFALKRKLLINNIWSESKENSSNQKLNISTFQYKILNTNFDDEIDIWKILIGYRYFSPRKMSKIIQKFSQLINQEYRKFPAIIDLYLRNQDAPSEIYSQVEFLIYTTALEAYVSSKDYNKCKQVDDEYEQIIKNIRKEYPEVKELENILSYQYSFSEKIFRCIENEGLNNVFRFYYEKENKIKIISDIVNLRNYFTHYSFSADDKRIKNINMSELKENLKILIEAFILHELQINHNDMSKIIANNTFRMLAFNNTYMWVPHPRYRTNINKKYYLGSEFYVQNHNAIPMDLDLYYKDINENNIMLIGKHKKNNKLQTYKITISKNITSDDLTKLPKYFQECYKRYVIADKQVEYINN